jgi:hypothetical protein
LLKKSYRWRIGNGESIPIWNTPWLRNGVNPFFTTPNPNNSGCPKVNELIDVQTNCWNAKLDS